jgi:transposase-like protein
MSYHEWLNKMSGKQLTTHTRTKYDEEFKKNAVQLSYASPKSVREILTIPYS